MKASCWLVSALVSGACGGAGDATQSTSASETQADAGTSEPSSTSGSGQPTEMDGGAVTEVSGVDDSSGTGDSDGTDGTDGTGDTGDTGDTDGAEVDVCGAWDGVFPAEAFLVTPADKAELQALLATHKVLRLAPGDYREGGPASITLASDQAIVSLVPSTFPDVVVAAGTTHARLQGVQYTNIRFAPGAASRYNCFYRLKAVRIEVTAATVERNLFVALAESTLAVDTSADGLFADNRFIKLNSHGGGLPIDIKGDAGRRSGGNAFLLTDSQTPPGSAFAITGQRDIAFVGVNVEAYNWNDTETAPFVFKVENTGTFRGTHATGISRAGTHEGPAFDLDAESVILHEFAAGTDAPQLRLGAANKSLVSWHNGFGPANIDDQAAGALRLSMMEGIDSDVSVTLGWSEITEEPEANTSAALHEVLAPADRPGAPWGLPVFAAIPDPTGPDWAVGLADKADESQAIQALVDEQTIAQLEPRTYYIAAPIVLHAGQGLIGAGAGQTALVATSATLDMIKVVWGEPDGCQATTGAFTLADITLQGGLNGIHSDVPGTQINQAVISHVTFRDMAHAGIFVDRAYGWDNNVLDYVNFVDSAYGFRQEGQAKPDDSCYGIGEWSTMAYVDKTVFYRNQFLRCGQGLVLHPTRANNLDGVVESSFRDSTEFAAEIGGGNNGFMFASSVFANNSGDPSVRGGAALVNCSFVADQAQSLLPAGNDMEGCHFARGTSRSATIFGDIKPGDWRNPNFFNVVNSVSDMPLGAVATTLPVAGMYFNNVLAADEPFSAFMTALEYRTLGTPDAADDSRSVYTLMSGPVSPGSQLLFGAAWAP